VIGSGGLNLAAMPPGTRGTGGGRLCKSLTHTSGKIRTPPHDGHFTQAMCGFFKDFAQKRGIALRTSGLTYEDTLFEVDGGKTQKEPAK